MALLFVVGAAGVCSVSGLAADTKPAPTNTFTFYETDTGRNYLANGSTWNLVLNPDYATAAQGATADAAQPLLVSGTNIKTVNGTTILGAGDLVVASSAPSLSRTFALMGC